MRAAPLTENPFLWMWIEIGLWNAHPSCPHIPILQGVNPAIRLSQYGRKKPPTTACSTFRNWNKHTKFRQTLTSGKLCWSRNTELPHNETCAGHTWVGNCKQHPHLISHIVRIIHFGYHTFYINNYCSDKILLNAFLSTLKAKTANIESHKCFSL